MKIYFLGTGPASGWPGYLGSKRKRRRPSTYLLVCGSTKIFMDVGSLEAAHEGVERVGRIDAILISHGHPDHWVGLNYFRWAPEKVKVHLGVGADSDTLSYIVESPYSLDFTFHDPFKSFRIGEVAVSFVPLNHIKYTYGFLIECEGKRLAYLLDTKGLPRETLDVVRGVDYVLLDASCPDELGCAMHNTVSEAKRLAEEIGAKMTFMVHLLPMLDEKVYEGYEVPDDGDVYVL